MNWETIERDRQDVAIKIERIVIYRITVGGREIKPSDVVIEMVRTMAPVDRSLSIKLLMEMYSICWADACILHHHLLNC